MVAASPCASDGCETVLSDERTCAARRNLAGTVGAVTQENTASTPTNVICHVQFARFADGRVWKWGDRSTPTTPGLYYPPTPSPLPGP